MDMNLYKETPVESYGHECFFQKMLICCDKTRLIFVQNQLGNSDVIDTYVTNPDDFKDYETKPEYLAHIKLITEDGERPYEIALTTPIDLQHFEVDIHNSFVDIYRLVDGKMPRKITYDKDSDYEQLKYLITYDKPMADVEPCEAVKEVLKFHEEYLKSDDIRLAYIYEEKIKKDDQTQIIVQTGFAKCREILKSEIRALMKKLGYNVELKWLNDCSLEQLQRIFDFDWLHETPSFQQIKDRLTV